MGRPDWNCAAVLLVSLALCGCAHLGALPPGQAFTSQQRREAVRRAAVWSPTNAANQRRLCPSGDETGRSGCRRPVLMVNDLGLTFGHAGLLNKNRDSVSLSTWTQLPVWKDRAHCVAQLERSYTGSLGDPEIHEAGRAFLAALLVQLTDAQLRDLFETARVRRRSTDPDSDPGKDGPPARVDERVNAFKLKRAQMVDQRCPI